MSEASDLGWGPVAEGDRAGLLKKPRENTLVGQQKGLAKGSRAFAPSGARETEAPLGPKTSYTGAATGTVIP